MNDLTKDFISVFSLIENALESAIRKVNEEGFIE